ncbi:MAG: hypothetical protein LBI67_11670, partial [Treponema sp.]|nr:hypothetical protein [Treponema sp.]
MNKAMLFGTAALLALLAGCNNFFHDLVPPDGNRIVSFSVSGQLDGSIGENDITVTVGPGEDITRLLPAITVSDKASLLPITLPYIKKAFPSSSVFQEAMALYTSGDRANYVINLIEQNRDFTVPALDEAMDFSGPVTFLVVSGLGTIRQYTVRVEVDTGEGKFLSFGFTKFDNPDLTRGDAAVTVNNTAKTITAELWYPVEDVASFVLVPSFTTNGAAVSLGGTELTSGVSAITFAKPAPGWTAVSRTETLTVQRPGFSPADYTLTVTFREDPDTIRSITDFRFIDTLNYGIRYTAMGTITDTGDTGDTGTITLKVYYTGSLPGALTPSFVT